MKLLKFLFAMRISLFFIGFSGILASEEKPKVIIIGAGAAGIAAALRLLDNGIEDVTLLEAEERIGGRTTSMKFGEYMVDLGGELGDGGEEDIGADGYPLPFGILQKFADDLRDLASVPSKPFGRRRRSNGESIADKSQVNTRIAKIKYHGHGLVKVISADGSELEADHVICTVPLGVLKGEYKELFDPQLPKKHVNSIKNLGLMQNDKIFLYYDEPWWETEEMDNKQFHWSEEDKNKIKSNPHRSWILGITHVVLIEKKPKLLVLWMNGSYCEEMEKISEEIFKNEILEFMKIKFTDSYEITEPKKIMRTLWATNENFRGSVSYRSAVSHHNHASAEDLGSPIMRNRKPIIQFAGEATDPDNYGTIRGALDSGLREADRLINLYNRK